MFRFALENLKNWHNSEDRKPLVIRGARQVGKTWLVRELAKKLNLQLIEINFELHPQKKSLFESNEPKEIITVLEANTGTQINPTNTLLFLDEAQKFPEILPKLRWFYELMPELAVITTGSLLEFVLDEHEFSMPVGRISYYHLEPLSFDEFLYQKNKQMLDFLNNYDWGNIPEAIHSQVLKYLQEYIIVGGLPEAVKNWLDNNSTINLNRLQHDIITTYRDDFMRYKGRFSADYFDNILNYIPKNISNKIVYSHISNSAVNSTKTAINLMTLARVIHKVQSCSGNGIPLGAEVNDKHTKAIMLDIGLMNNILGLNLNDFTDIDNIILANKGAVAEQLVGQQLRTIEPFYVEPKLFYWQRDSQGSNAEIDYLIAHGNNVLPIEVKAGKKGSLQSLHMFMKLKNLNTALRLNTNMPEKKLIKTKIFDGSVVEYQLISLPIYMIGQIRRIMEKM